MDFQLTHQKVNISFGEVCQIKNEQKLLSGKHLLKDGRVFKISSTCLLLQLK